jgi:hypothetical protein
MNDVSRAVVATVHALNKSSGRNICAYTFDAGPNAVRFTLCEHEFQPCCLILCLQVLFCLRSDLPALARVIITLFPPAGAMNLPILPSYGCLRDAPIVHVLRIAFRQRAV